MPTILDGAAIAAAIKQEVAEEVKLLAAQGIRPGLAAVLVGHVPASEIYVRSKVQTCAELGLYSDLIAPPDTVTTEEMFDLVNSLNHRDDVDGILIQLPLPAHVDTARLLEAADPAKDVDGFHPINSGRLLSGAAAIFASHRNPATSLIDLESMQLKTYSLSVYGASAFRIAVSVLPFLLPLMFQIAFGLNAFHSGLYLLALFAGDLSM